MQSPSFRIWYGFFFIQDSTYNFVLTTLKKVVVKLNILYSQFALRSRTFAALALCSSLRLAEMPDANVFKCKTENGNVVRYFQDGCWHSMRVDSN
jgi:hypothetical protein